MNVAIPAATGGESYRVETTLQRVRVSRKSNAGRVNAIEFTTDDALAVSNALVDAVEQLQNGLEQ